MSTRLQVVLSEEEARRYRRRARREGLTLSEWVRRILRGADRGPTGPDRDRRLQAIERALRCGHPTADTGQMLAEIERGRSLR